MAMKEELVNMVEIEASSSEAETPSLFISADAIALGPSRISAPMVKSVMRSKLARVDEVRALNLNVSTPPSPVIRSLALVAVSVFAVAVPMS